MHDDDKLADSTRETNDNEEGIPPLSEEATRQLLDCLIEGIAEDGAHDYKSEIEELSEECRGNLEWLALKKQLKYDFPLKRAMEDVVYDSLANQEGAEERTIDDTRKLCRFYARYQECESVLERMMANLFGIAASADKARAVMQLLQLRIENDPRWDVVFTRLQKEGSYFVPAAGSAIDWADFAEAVVFDEYDKIYLQSVTNINAAYQEMQENSEDDQQSSTRG